MFSIPHTNIAAEHHLYNLISTYLLEHPATEDSPMRFKPQGLPLKDDKYIPPAIPNGFKMGNILPLHSPALSGGGVSDNFLKDMMAEMGGQMPEGMEGLANMANMGGGGGGGAPKKIRVGKKR